MKTLAVGGAVLSVGNAVFPRPTRAAGGQKVDIGECRRVTVTSISEVGWWDDGKLISTIKAAGGPSVSQWETRWEKENSAGSSSLVTVEGLGGSKHNILIDTGWDPKYMDERFQSLGVDKMLDAGEIEFLYLTHEHLDHLWGLETTLKYRPDIKIVAPSTFHREAFHFMRGAEYKLPGAANHIEHTGELQKLEPGGVHQLLPGAASVTFDMPVLLAIEGEQSLFFNIKDHGIVCVTGCCHQKITRYADFARDTLVGGDNLYGLYGGLHLSPFGPLKPEAEKMVEEMGQYGFKKIAANHCTGLAAVEKMLELGYPVVKGSGKDGSKSDLYIGNGDSVTFG